jgi:drug/metabolite transporter (DMT)-like permease
MKLITAHKILIASATIFFVFFALWEWRNYSATGEDWAAFRSVLYFIVAVGFGIYFKNLKRLYKLR